MRQVATIMGVPISIDIDTYNDKQAITAAFRRLEEIDTLFSTYKPNSEINCLQRGELSIKNASDDIRTTKQLVDTFAHLTSGFFSPYYNGAYDPTGFIKGWGVHQAGLTLQQAGVFTYLINAAGDIEAASDGNKTWTIALQHPTDRQTTIASLQLQNGAIATSGTYERGTHIINPYTHQPARELVSTTVVGPNIATADAFATACLAMGKKRALDFIATQPDYQAILIDQNGTIATSNGILLH